MKCLIILIPGSTYNQSKRRDIAEEVRNHIDDEGDLHNSLLLTCKFLKII